MTAEELMESCIVYRMMFATHALFRVMGYSADDIYPFIMKNAGQQLQIDGRTFTVVCCETLPREYDEFVQDFKDIVAGSSTISEAMMVRCKAEWLERYSLPEFVVAMHAKGFTPPIPDAIREMDGAVVH